MSNPTMNTNTTASENVEIGSPPEKPSPTLKKPGFFSRAHILGPVVKDHGDLPLLVCCFVTGMVDAGTFGNWAVFVGMQTGNTVILGLSTAGLPANPHAWLTTLISLASFLLGAFTTFRLSKLFVPQGPQTSRLWSSGLFFLQGLLILIAAALATPKGLIPQNPGGLGRTAFDPVNVVRNVKIVALLPLLGFQSGMQIATSRLLGYNELPVNVLTSTYCDLMGDFNLTALNNVKRNRRAIAAVLLLLGAICSGWLMRSSAGLFGIFWIAGGIKVLTGVVMFVAMPSPKMEVV